MGEPLKTLSGIQVLCVDDHPDSLTLLTTVLARYGAVVTPASSAEQALEHLFAKTFDLLISDLMMPKMDGFDLARALREKEKDEGKQTPAIALSGHLSRTSPKRRFGDFQIYLSKPFERHRLVQVVERLAEAGGEAVRAGSLELWEADRNALEEIELSEPG